MYGDHPASTAADGCHVSLHVVREDAARLRREYVRALRKLPRAERDLHARLALQEAMADPTTTEGGDHG